MSPWQGRTGYLVPQFLDHGVVGVLVGHVESAVDGTAVRVLVVRREDLVLQESVLNLLESCLL